MFEASTLEDPHQLLGSGIIRTAWRSIIFNNVYSTGLLRATSLTPRPPFWVLVGERVIEQRRLPAEVLLVFRAGPSWLFASRLRLHLHVLFLREGRLFCLAVLRLSWPSRVQQVQRISGVLP